MSRVSRGWCLLLQLTQRQRRLRMNAERLLKMAGFLEALPAHKFDFGMYVTLGTKTPAEALADPEGHCGTTACAVGWMPAIFPDAYKWGVIRDELMPVPIDLRFISNNWYRIEDTIRAFLGLLDSEYQFLFIPDSSPLGNEASAVAVAQQIREFVATDGRNLADYQEVGNEYVF